MFLSQLLLATAGHPTPRHYTAGHELDWTRFRCPNGPYLVQRRAVQRDGSGRLHRHLRQALSRGMVPSLLDATVMASQNSSLIYTHESAAWPKPARCRERQQHVCALSPHFCLALPYGNAPRSSLVSRRYGLEFRQVWKVASSSLASFFHCNMYGVLRAEKLLPGQPPKSREAKKAPIVAFASREPIGRFIASAFEVLERVINRVLPGGQRLTDDMFAGPHGAMSHAVLSSRTSWYLPLRALLNLSSGGASSGESVEDRAHPTVQSTQRQYVIDALVGGFIDDLECGLVYSASEHMSTQMAFVTSGYAERATLDFQIRLHNISSDLEELGAHLGYSLPEGGSRNNGSIWKCALGRENDVTSKAKIPVDKNDFLATLRRTPSLVQRLCTVYIQDFVCLGFALPVECESGRELNFLGDSLGRDRGAWSAKTGPARPQHSLDGEAVP